MRFRTTLLLHGVTATGLEVPPAVVEALGAGRRPPVTVTLAGRHTYRSTVAVLGGVPVLPVSAEHRAAAGIAAGDEIDVELELDTEPRTVEVPPALAQLLEQHPGAGERFRGLSPSNQKRHVLAVEGARTDATRERRLAKVLEELS